MYKAIKAYNKANEIPDDSPSILEELYEKFKAMTPKERNEALQALFASHLAGRNELDGVTLDLFKALMKSFEVSIRFEELSDEEPLPFGNTTTDIRKVRDEHKE